MGAMAQLKIPVEEVPMPEQEVVIEDLPEALALIERLQNESHALRVRLKEKKHLAEQKRLSLGIMMIQEQMLRSKLMRT